MDAIFILQILAIDAPDHPNELEPQKKLSKEEDRIRVKSAQAHNNYVEVCG